MSAAQGGNKKSSSQSDQNYWKRAQMGNFHDTHRAKRIARHAARVIAQNPKRYASMPNALAHVIKEITFGENPQFPSKRWEARTAERVVLNGTAPKGKIVYPLHLVTVAGVLIEISPRQSDAVSAINEAHTGLEYSHTLLHDSGRTQLVSSRNAR